MLVTVLSFCTNVNKLFVLCSTTCTSKASVSDYGFIVKVWNAFVLCVYYYSHILSLIYKIMVRN